jgi:hypothetical protein
LLKAQNIGLNIVRMKSLQGRGQSCENSVCRGWDGRLILNLLLILELGWILNELLSQVGNNIVIIIIIGVIRVPLLLLVLRVGYSQISKSDSDWA